MKGQKFFRVDFALAGRQSGAALAVVLILLLVVTLIGLTSVRSTLLQERMSSSILDRNIALQQAESALRSGEEYIRKRWQAGDPESAADRDCSQINVLCEQIPANAYGGNGGPDWNDVPSSTLDSRQGTPQYYIEYMGRASTGDSNSIGFGESANAAQYGATGGQVVGHFFRITARSANPASSQGRAIVVIQSRIAIK